MRSAPVASKKCYSAELLNNQGELFSVGFTLGME